MLLHGQKVDSYVEFIVLFEFRNMILLTHGRIKAEKIKGTWCLMSMMMIHSLFLKTKREEDCEVFLVELQRNGDSARYKKNDKSSHQLT